MRANDFPMRCLPFLGCVLVLASAVKAHAVDLTIVPPLQSAPSTFNFDPRACHLSCEPLLDTKPAKRNESIFSGVDLGGSTLNFQGDRKPPRVGAETFEPGTLVQSQKARGIGPSFFGLSIKKPLEWSASRNSGARRPD
jgi:hypothetical protein